MSTYQHIDFQSDGPIAAITLLPRRLQRDEVSDALRQELLRAWEEFPVDQWILDFQHVEFLSTAGLQCLFALQRKLQPRRARILLCNVKPQVAEVFRVTHLAGNGPNARQPFELTGDRQEALQRLRRLRWEMIGKVLVFHFVDKELHGEDLAELLGGEIAHGLEATKAHLVALDFAAVEMISTPCMRPLLALRTRLRQEGGHVLLCNLSPQVQEIFEVTRFISSKSGTTALFEAAANVPAAVAALQAR